MGLEHWDSNRQKYVLYQNIEQHSDDCGRFPFEIIPRRVFLDTNVINVLVKHSTRFRARADPAQHRSNARDRYRSADACVLCWDAGRLVLVGSQKTIDELSRTRDGTLRDDLLEYALGIFNRDLGDEDRRFAADFGRRLIDAPFVAALPDLADRELIGNAIGFGCDVFCTCDRATIVRKRGHLRQVPYAF